MQGSGRELKCRLAWKQIAGSYPDRAARWNEFQGALGTPRQDRKRWLVDANSSYLARGNSVAHQGRCHTWLSDDLPVRLAMGSSYPQLPSIWMVIGW
jgi:hypothetical protein